MQSTELEKLFRSTMALENHARTRFEELDRITHKWLMTEPWLPFQEPDPGTGDQIFGVELREPVPDKISLTAFDLAHSLRSVLDHAVNAGTTAFQQPNRKTAFPFGENREDVVASLRKGSCKGVAQQLEQTLVDLEPFEGGNKYLVALNRLRNANTHRALVQPTINMNDIAIETVKAPTGWISLIAGPWEPDSKRFIAARAIGGIKGQFSICFNQRPVLMLNNEFGVHEYIVSAFANMGDAVGKAVQAIAKQTRSAAP